MKNIIYFVATLLIALTSVSCNDDVIRDEDNPLREDGRLIEIETACSFPEMNFGASTRAMGEEPTPEELLNSLYVNLFVYDSAGVMLQFIEPKDIEVINIDPATKNVIFKVRNIYSSSLPRRLHFVVTSAPDLHQIDGGDYISAMAGEKTTMPALVVSNDEDAYWGVKDVDAITEDMELHVKLIRNFVKLTVNNKDTRNFKLLGYTVVNRPGKGTVAPFIYEDHLFASFLNPESNDLLSYDDVISQGYLGVNPAGGDSNMKFTTEAEVSASLAESRKNIEAGLESPYYIYERTQSGLASAGSDVKVTYIIIEGEYKGERYYYKIDIGRDQAGKFAFYDLLRNFQYTVEIEMVGGRGASTLIEAMNGSAHNNLSTSVVTRDLFSIGYKGDMIEVSSTRVIFTEKTVDYELKFRYSVPSGTASGTTVFEADKLRIYDLNNEDVEYTMTGVGTSTYKTIDLEGEVIQSASVKQDTQGWYILRVSSKDIPDDSRRGEQNIRIYYTGGTAGLGRTVTFMLRRPWEFSGVSSGNPGGNIQDKFTLKFKVPSGMAKALFPLILVFESDKQNIYSENGSPLMVESGKSGFSGATTDRIMMYEWTLEWEDYSHADGSEGGEYTANFRMNTTTAEDRAYSTTGIDNRNDAHSGRLTNNGTAGFCIRISNKGQKYLEPYYVNVTRN